MVETSSIVEHQVVDRHDWVGRDLGLTVRESEILVLIVAGLSNQAIAYELYLSVNSIKSHIRTAYARIGVDTRTQAILWGIDHGFRAVPAAADRASGPGAEVTRSRIAAEEASRRAEATWERLRLALENGESAAALQRQLSCDVARQVYAWAVHHGAAVDASQPRS